MFVCGLVGAGVLVIAGITVAALDATAFSPQREALRWADALAAGRASQERDIAGEPARPGPLFTDDVGRELHDRPHVVAARRARAGADQFALAGAMGPTGATPVTIEWDQAGTRSTSTVWLEVRSRRWGLVPQWRIVRADLPVLDASRFVAADDVTSVLVNGTSVALGGAGDTPGGASGPTVLPGRYTVTLPGRGQYVDATTVRVDVAPDGQVRWAGGDRLLAYTPNAAARQVAMDLAQKAVGDCLPARSPRLSDGCAAWLGDLGGDPPRGVRDVAWKVVKQPTYRATGRGGLGIEVAASGGEVRATGTRTLPHGHRSRWTSTSRLDFTLDYALKGGQVTPARDGRSGSGG